MLDTKQKKLTEKIQYYMAFVLIYLFFVAIFSTISSYYRFNPIFEYSTYLTALFLTVFACFNPMSVVLLRHKSYKISDEQKIKLLDLISKTPNLSENAIKIHVVIDNQPNVFLVSQPNINHIIFTNSALKNFNIIDFEAIFAYFSAKKQAKPHFIDTIYLLIATLLEKAIIVKPLAGIFANMTVTYGERHLFDKKAVEITKNPICYKKMLAKAKNCEFNSNLGKAFSVVGIFDTGISSKQEMISEIDKRINFVAKA